MQQHQTVPDVRIAGSGQPANLLLRQTSKITTQRVNKQRFRHLSQHCLAAGIFRCSLFNQMKQRRFQPLARFVSSQVNFECRWKTLQNRTAEQRIANHKAANETRDFTAAASLHRTEIASLQLCDRC